MKTVVAGFLAVLLGALFFGCSKSSPSATTITKHDTTYVSQAKVIYSGISRYYAGGPPAHYATEEIAWIWSDPAANLAQSYAQIKSVNTQFNLTKKQEQGPGMIALQDTLPVPWPGIPCSLIVSTNSGSGRAGNVSISGTFTLNTPRNGDTLAWGDVVASWSPAQYATYYYLYVSYNAYNGTTWLGWADTDTFTTGSSIVIPQAFFRKFGSATYLDANIDVDACNGAKPGPGESGNINGEFKGVFFSMSSDITSCVSFYMGSPKSLLDIRPMPRISKVEMMKRLFRTFQISGNGSRIAITR